MRKRPKPKPKITEFEVCETQKMIAYLKSQIAIFEKGQNKSPRMEGYYREELKEWEDKIN